MINNLNSVLIEGKLAEDPILKTTPKGTSVCTFSVACKRFLKRDTGTKEEDSSFDVVAWAKLAENCHNRGRKGRGLRVVGRLKQERWFDAGGNAHSRVVIVADHVEFRPESNREESGIH